MSGISFAESNVDGFFKNSSSYQNVLVTRVISPDLFELESGEKIKMIGLNAPKSQRKKVAVKRDQFGFVMEEKVTPITSVENQAFDFVESLLKGKRVRLEFDVERSDEEHFTLAYVFLINGDILINDVILRQGFANLHIHPPNLKYAARLRDAYKEAYKQRRGFQND